ncbi:TonB-dependent receptor [Hydrocarboniphaga effusa]|uniref:TonB-dependent receptor n=1 Tax=Hydrocarboniphaga effusa TaxID=243629 RepID=UPI00398BC1CC
MKNTMQQRLVASFTLASLFCSGAAWAGGVPVVELPAMQVTGEATLEDTASSSTEGYVTADQLAERPISRAGELLEFVPGLIVTQHSGEGKANQYFLRGFNLDHGTDFYSEVDGLPVNMRTHGHGQGYADINFMIPELIGSLEYRKGPYYADVGDFGAAGSARLRYVDELPAPMARLTIGEYGYRSALVAASPKLAGGTLLLGGEATRYDGAYDLKQDAEIYKGIARYNRGTDEDGYTIGFQVYAIDYFAPDQIPLRAVQSGQIDQLGFIDPTDGGDVRRFSLNAELRKPAALGHWKAAAYALSYKMQLYSDFTYYFTDPNDTDALPDDQFEQYDDRKVFGASLLRYWQLPTRIPIDIETGLQSRYDRISPVGLYLTQRRERTETVRQDKVKEASLGWYLSSRQQWTNWYRTELGARADFYDFDVDSDLAANSGKADDHLVAPKAAMIFGPFERTEFYLNYGEGFHSNDARGTTIRLDPTDPTHQTPADRVTPLVRVRGAEMGLTSAMIPHTKLTATLWQLKSDSELVYIGDAGNSEAGPPSTRRGVELSAYYEPLPWLAIDADYAYSHGRLDVPAEVRAADGDRIPNSIEDVISVGVTVPETQGWSAGLRLRRLGEAALIEDNSARSKPTTVVNAQGSYRFLKRYLVSLAILNVFDSDDNDITYYYESRLPGEPAEGVADYHFHPVEPRAVRLTIGASL